MKSGNDILFHSQQFKRRHEVLTGKIRREKKKISLTEMTIDDEPIFEKLKEFRLSLSKKLKLPAFVIFPDKTLIEMAKLKPETLDELEKIYGVGKAKLEKFGKDFLNIISNK